MTPYPILRRTIFPLLRKFFRKVEGLENLPRHGPYIIAINHIGSIDYFFIISAVIGAIHDRIHFIARSEKWRDYLARRWWDCIIIDPDHKNQCLAEATRCLQRGEICVIFPEGTASRNSPELLEGKVGVASLALATGAPVIPMGFLGPWGKNSFYASLKNIVSFFRKIEMRIGPLVVFAPANQGEITGELLKEKTRIVMTRVASLCQKIYPY